MKNNRRTQAERTAATRDALIAAGRALFAIHGFAGVGAEAIVRAAGLSRGALYHQFADKTELFAAVFEAVEADIIVRIGAKVAAAAPTDPLAAIQVAAAAFLEVSTDPEAQRVVMIDGPSVLGWMRWREIGARYGMRLTQDLIEAAVAAGRIAPQPVDVLAHVLLGAVREGALYLAAAPDPAQARREVGDVVDRMIAALAQPPV
ncbi:MAG TPA: TetR/AcrR family transcriptional regulator [Phenylobacterium sp.]|nr:TetR/AcrR family transcriptional regulator [Phenylobacterium sp.]